MHTIERNSKYKLKQKLLIHASWDNGIKMNATVVVEVSE